MRIVNVDGRLGLLTEAGVVDVETASGGRFGSDPQAVYAQWAQLRSWATEVELDASSARPLDDVMLGAPAPRPSQVFAIGLNYWDHAEESGLDASTESLVVFTKFPSSITGPFADIVVPAGSVDFEVELVVYGLRGARLGVRPPARLGPRRAALRSPRARRRPPCARGGVVTSIIVTGASGMLGRRLVQRLVAAGHDVRGLARSEAAEAAVAGIGATPVRRILRDRVPLRRRRPDLNKPLSLDAPRPRTDDLTDRQS